MRGARLAAVFFVAVFAPVREAVFFAAGLARLATCAESASMRAISASTSFDDGTPSFFIAFIASTLLPLASEPAVFALVKLNPEMFWPAIGAGTAGATLGGALTWWMGYGAERAYEHMTHKHRDGRALRWLRRFGAKACLLSWLPVVGDPLCAVAGWLQLPFWPCVVYMAIGKFARYFGMTAALIWFFPGQYVH